jgi:archaellum biogenesis protein FlaJ (TadC family)
VRPLKTNVPNWYRIVLLVVGIAWLIWLSIEDLSERWVLLFSVTICVLMAIRFIIYYSAQLPKNEKRYSQSKDQQSNKQFLFYPIVGSLTGLAVTPVALFLMALKTGLHSHLAPEFTSSQVIIVLARTPIWIIGGLLIGVGMGLISWSQQTK